MKQMKRPPIKVDLDSCESVKCENCGGEIFTVVYVIKKIPPLLSRSGREELLSLPYFRCVACGKLANIIKSDGALQ